MNAKILVTTLLLLMGPISAARGGFMGSISLGAAGTSVTTGENLLNRNMFDFNMPYLSGGSGGFSVVPNFHFLSPDSLSIDLTSAATASNLTLSSPSWGTFSASQALILERSAGFVQVLLTGSFDNSSVDGVAFTYTDVTAAGGEPASLRYSMTNTGNAVSWSGTLTLPSETPPNVVPEPSSLAIFGFGALGLVVGGARRRKKKQIE